MPNALENVKVGEVSFCRKGMNRHARVALFKSADVPSTPQAIAKATFEEALQANMTADAVNEAFYESFDGLWERNDAFRAALTDELAAGGDGTTASEAYVASVKQLVDEAVQEARQAGASATSTTGIDKALSTAVETWLRKKEQQTMKITNRAELQAAVSSFDIAKATIADVQSIQKAAEDLKLEDLLPADGPLAKAKPSEDVTKLQREIAVLKLSPDSKAHFETLDESGQTAFLAKSADDQAADIAKAKSADPVVYTCKDGTEIRKSDGAAAVMLAKRADTSDAELAKLRGDLSGTTIEKRAGDDYPNVAKTTAVAMLKSAAAVGEDTDAGKDIIKSLDQMNKSRQGMFKRAGSTEGAGDFEPTDATTLQKARTTFDGKVNEIAGRDKIGKADAMSKAREEHPDLWAEAFPDTVQAVEDAAERALNAPA